MTLGKTDVVRLLGKALCCAPCILVAPVALAADANTDLHPKAVAAAHPSAATKTAGQRADLESSSNTRAGVGTGNFGAGQQAGGKNTNGKGTGKNTGSKETGSYGSGQDGGHRGNVNVGNGHGGDNPDSAGSSSHVKGPGGQDGGHRGGGKFGNGTGGDNPNGTNGNHGSAGAPANLLGNQGANTGSRGGRGGDDPRENGADKSTQALHNGQRGGAKDPTRAGLVGNKGQKADWGDGWFGGSGGKKPPAPAPSPDGGPKPTVEGATPINKPAPPPKDPGPGGGPQKLKPYVPPKAFNGNNATHN